MRRKKLDFVATFLMTSSLLSAEVTLEEINVTTATKTTQNINNITSNIDIITARDIQERGYTSVTEALNMLAGISFTQNGGIGRSASVYLRGMDSKRTLVLLNGIRYNDHTGLSGAPYEHLMVSDIAHIEVIKGAQSGVWGADASAGVINIITKKAALGTQGALHIEKGSFNTQKYGITLSKKTDELFMKLSHNTVKTDGFSAQHPDDTELDMFEDDGYENKTTTMDISYSFDEANKIDISHTTIEAQGEYDTFGNANAIATDSTKDTFGSINYSHTDSFNILNIFAKHSEFDRKYTAPDFTGTTKTTPYKGDVVEFGLNSKIPYAKKDFILIGAEYKKFNQDDTVKKAFDNKGIFITNSNTFDGFVGGETTLSESVRYDSYSDFENRTTFKIGLKHTHDAIKGLSGSINYGTSYNIPTLYQLYSPYGFNGLAPEHTESFDITLAYKNFKISYFDNKIEDMIDFDLTTFKYSNIAGESKVSGIEASYQKEFVSELLFSINYTHLLKAQDYKRNKLKRRIADHVKLAVDYYGIRDFHIGLEAEYVGDRIDTKFNPDFSKIDVQTGKYTLLHISANYILDEEIEFYGRIVNLTDERYQTVYGYAASPRAFYAGVRAKF